MSDILTALGYSKTDLANVTQLALAGGNGGEFYLSTTSHISVSMENGIVTSSHYSENAGGSFRRINGRAADFVTFDSLNSNVAEDFAKRLAAVPQGQSTPVNLTRLGKPTNNPYYFTGDVLGGVAKDDFLTKIVTLLGEIDDYTRKQDNRITDVMLSFSVQDEKVMIQRFDGNLVEDVRPMSTLSVSLIMADGERKERGGDHKTVPIKAADLFAEGEWKKLVSGAVDMASNNLTAIDVKAGEDYTVVVSNGWGGVLLHEAFGHGLEADFHDKGMAAFQGMIGKRIASKGVNIYDDGTVQDARGTLHFDDEGNPTNKTLLVDDGILVGLMTDEISAAQMNMPVTGNGRRQSFSHVPIPRMTNTYMEGQKGVDVESLIKDVKKGIYVMQFGGGQVDITSGKFEFNASVARLIENGKLGAYVKGCTLAGMGKDAFMHVDGIADDMEVSVYGNCGKDGQGVPVTVGQGTTRLAAGAVSVGGNG